MQKHIRILLMEDEPDEIQLLEEAFLEIEEKRFSRGWQACERVYAVSLEEGLTVLARDRFDVILLDLSLPGGVSLHSFLRVHAQAPETPIIVLTSSEDEPLALSLVRQGAQDYLIKSDLDCAPLARVLRCSIERNRLSVVQQSISLMDDLTTLYNHRGLTHLGERHWNLAQQHKLHVLVMQASLPGLDKIREALSMQERDIALIEAADLLRGAFSETDLIARTGTEQFTAIALLETSAAVQEKIHHISRQLSGLATLQLGWAYSEETRLEDLLTLAGRSLCENRLVENRAGCYL
ncbi:MAG: response regulator [Acidobacteriia bacterium]|nr:response regulator [Terriglobia bacterium]